MRWSGRCLPSTAVTLDPRTPVLVGTGQTLQRNAGLDDALDATGLMALAIEQAAADAGLAGVPSQVDRSGG